MTTSPNINANDNVASEDGRGSSSHRSNNNNSKSDDKTSSPETVDLSTSISAPSSALASASSSSSLADSSSFSQMCLTPCHRFHTNPTISSPKHLISNFQSPPNISNNNNSNNNSKSNNNNNNSSSKSKSKSGVAGTSPARVGGGGGGGSNNNNYHHHPSSLSINSSKALKRKQRLAQYKAQTNHSGNNNSSSNSNTENINATESSTANDSNTNNHNTSSSSSTQQQQQPSSSTTLPLNLATPSDLKALSSTLALNSSSTNSTTQDASCHVKWAPNLNYIKNVELVAISSPLTDNINSYSSSIHSKKDPNGCTYTHPNLIRMSDQPSSFIASPLSPNTGSVVFVLVFDEGIFSHNGDFSISTELCDLFGLPTQNLVNHDGNEKKKNGGDDTTTTDDNNNNTSSSNSSDKNEGVDKNKKRCGLRRRVFQNYKTSITPTESGTTGTGADTGTNGDEIMTIQEHENKKKDDILKTGKTTSSTSTTKTPMVSNKSSSSPPPTTTTTTSTTTTTPSTKMEKLESSYNAISNNVIKPLFNHVSHEIENCIQILKHEVMGDGRIQNSNPAKAFALTRRKVEEVTAEMLSSKSTTATESTQQPQATTTNTTNNNNDDESSYDQYHTSNNKTGITEVGSKSECPIKPTLVFRINLPYSTTSMEVTNLEWNADGTSLSIVQRRKGFSSTSNNNSSSSLSSSSTMMMSNSNVTKKKKKGTNNTSHHLPISPGNTAVSFWCIPPWLHVDYDEMKMSYEHDDEEMCEDKLIIKANNTCDDCGWEVEDEDENRSLFPLWEWYLAKYVFKDEVIPKNVGPNRGTKIMMKNVMEQSAYTMELSALSSGGTSSTSRHGKKSNVRGGRGSSGTAENVNAMMNGDVTCLFWEDATPEDEKILGPNAYKERQGHENDAIDSDDEGKSKNSDGKDDTTTNSKDKKHDSDAIATPSKWIAIGTSKGQIILHNSAASFLSNHTRKAKSKASTPSNNNAANLLSSISAQSRTVTVPVRHKKRVTCGAWVDNLLVFGYVGTGCLTLVSTFPKGLQRASSDRSTSGASRLKQEILEPLFGEKTAKVLGNIMLPGGRDAVDIQIGNIEDDIGSVTILSVNCEEKSLLFYTFPKLTEDAENSSHSDVTSSPAMEVNFTLNSSSIKGGSSCGNIIFHCMIPNTFLAVVAFSSGYFALVDWVGGLILNDKDVSMFCQDDEGGHTNGHNDDNFLLDVSFHLPTCTAVCLTSTGHIVVYHVRIRDKCKVEEEESSSKKEENFISVSSKTHTRPKTKSSSTSSSSAASTTHDHIIDHDSVSMLMMGTIDVLCAQKIIGPKGYRVDFSADGESVSVSLGDESVSIFSIKIDGKESNEIKERLAQKIFLFTPFQIRMVFHIAIVVLLWMYKIRVQRDEFGENAW